MTRDECEHGSLRRKCLVCELNAEVELWRSEKKIETAKRIEAESVSRATKKSHDRRQADAWAMVELRRLELQKYALMMACVPHASAQHRGPKSHRPIGMAS